MKIRQLPAIAASTFAFGCSTVPPGPSQSVEFARSTYRAAASDPLVVQSAPVELAAAQENLRRAEAAWQQGVDPAQVDHLAYIANQQALIAREAGNLARAERTIETASAERNQILLEAKQQTLVGEREKLALAQRRARAAEGIAAAQAERAAQLQKELQELSAHQTPLGMVMTLGDVLFDAGKATLKPGARRSLDRLAELMKKYPERNARIEGFTDNTGSAEANQELSRQRAEAVRNELVSRGIAGDRVQALGHGASFPVASNTTEAGRQQNRRVEVVISDETGNVTRR